jgi:glycosyltransferase involved in cell wall biosynthesis
MKNDKVNLLHVVNGLKSGGVEQMLINYFSSNVFDNYNLFIAYSNKADDSCLEQFKKNGFVTIELKNEPCKLRIRYLFELKKIMLNNKISILHTHINQDNYLPLIAAKMAGVKLRISHSHGLPPNTSSFFKKNVIRKLKRWLGIVFSNERLACSKKAGDALFEKSNYKIIYNSINIAKFKYNYNIRQELRMKFNIEKRMVIGYVARFENGKNQKFLLEVFKDIVINNPTAYLILIGFGIYKNELMKKITELNLSNNVLLLSSTENIYDYYQMFDLFAFPSLEEGLGMVAIESQVNGLFCIASTGVPTETKISDNIIYLPLNKSIWINEINNRLSIRKKELRYSCDSHNFDINLQRNNLLRCYLELRKK